MSQSQKFYKNTYRTSSLRAKSWDYAGYGTYFITICVKDKRPCFGKIVEDGVALSKIGEIVEKCWLHLPKQFEFVEIDDYVIMPNHIHGILTLNIDDTRRDAINRVSTRLQTGGITKDHNPMNKPHLGRVIRWLKGRSTFEIHHLTPSFAWQPNYYEHIIEKDRELEKIRQYIADNPFNWPYDEEFVSTPL